MKKRPPTRWQFHIGLQHPPDLGLVEPEVGLLVHFEGVARVTRITEKASARGGAQPYAEVALSPLELTVSRSVEEEEAPTLKAVAGA